MPKPTAIQRPERRRRFVRYSQLKEQYGIPFSKMHVDRLGNMGRFPRKVHLAPNTVGYWSDELEAWLEARSAERVA